MVGTDVAVWVRVVRAVRNLSQTSRVIRSVTSSKSTGAPPRFRVQNYAGCGSGPADRSHTCRALQVQLSDFAAHSPEDRRRRMDGLVSRKAMAVGHGRRLQRPPNGATEFELPGSVSAWSHSARLRDPGVR